MTHTLTVDAGARVRDLRAADHLLHALSTELGPPEAVFGCTHLVRGEGARVVLSFTFPSEPLLRAARERLSAGGHDVTPGIPDAKGRAVLYPGVTALTGTVPVADVLARSAIDRVTVLGSGDAAPEACLVTRGHVRPLWQGGRLVLSAMPAAGGTLAPFEVPNPTPCCANH
ncbi:hypothetical protein [Streptomyces sp. DSM 40484]|uniref:hypothetical protein n=1 Tax=Streptomyces kroppenstedtii TaxID=3051181 RepID=UPI0028D2F415|nr:hypothetical protein [Streptomyces sp. DSM 40484]